MLSQLLKNQGLSEKEIAIFTFLLERGEQPASIIAKNSQLSRSSCYASLESLVRKGFLSQINRGGISFYLICDLKVLLDQFKNQKIREVNQISLLRKDLNNPVPTNSFTFPKSRAHYFSGTEGMATLVQQVLSKNPLQMRVYLSKHSFISQASPGLFQQSTTAIKVLTSAEHKGLPPSAIQKILPTIFDCGIDIITTSNQVAIFCLAEQFGLSIDSNSIAAAQNKLFDFIWKIAKTTF
jgi:sugar-specific transcriptional regulator TrmB